VGAKTLALLAATVPVAVGFQAAVVDRADNGGNPIPARPAGSETDPLITAEEAESHFTANSVSLLKSSLTEASFFEDDLVNTITYGNTGTVVTTAYTYDVNGRPSTIETKQGSTQYLKMTYGDYDTVANPI